MELPIVELKYPVKIKSNSGETELKELKFNRKPRAGDFRKMDVTKFTMGDMLTIAAACCNVGESTIDQLDPEDMFNVVGAVAPFLSVSPQI